MSGFAGSEFIHRTVSKYSDMIVRIAFAYVKNRADAEDIMQDVFMSLIKQPPFNGEEHLKAWIIRAAVNRAKDYYRSNKKRNTVPLEAAANHLTELQESVFDDFFELPEKDRHVVYLFYYEGYTAKEIGAILGKKEKAVLMRLSRAREKLKKVLEERK
ncbi:MAG: sigma-70 family RNA polymerase sigma factor [Clostridiales bacterium]|nr:sigma-70 family RNA polymerase sigma factor [Clostridiales bacterium]